MYVDHTIVNDRTKVFSLTKNDSTFAQHSQLFPEPGVPFSACVSNKQRHSHVTCTNLSLMLAQNKHWITKLI